MTDSSSSWVNPWRHELQMLLGTVVALRRPALRRSRRPDYLFASDLPGLADPASILSFLTQAHTLGWETFETEGWIHLRRQSSSMPEGWFPFHPEGEAACLNSLLRRHPGTSEASRERIALLKAREEGPLSLERECRVLHQECARRLRIHAPLPEIQLTEKE